MPMRRSTATSISDDGRRQWVGVVCASAVSRSARKTDGGCRTRKQEGSPRLAHERQREALGRAPQARLRDDPREILRGRNTARAGRWAKTASTGSGRSSEPGGSACSSATAPRRRSSSSPGSMTRQRCALTGRRRTLMRRSARCSTRAIRRMTGRRSWKRPPARRRGSGRRRQSPPDPGKGILASLK